MRGIQKQKKYYCSKYYCKLKEILNLQHTWEGSRDQAQVAHPHTGTPEVHERDSGNKRNSPWTPAVCCVHHLFGTVMVLFLAYVHLPAPPCCCTPGPTSSKALCTSCHSAVRSTSQLKDLRQPATLPVHAWRSREGGVELIWSWATTVQYCGLYLHDELR